MIGVPCVYSWWFGQALRRCRRCAGLAEKKSKYQCAVIVANGDLVGKDDSRCAKCFFEDAVCDWDWNVNDDGEFWNNGCWRYRSCASMSIITDISLDMEVNAVTSEVRSSSSGMEVRVDLRESRVSLITLFNI